MKAAFVGMDDFVFPIDVMRRGLKEVVAVASRTCEEVMGNKLQRENAGDHEVADKPGHKDRTFVDQNDVNLFIAFFQILRDGQTGGTGTDDDNPFTFGRGYRSGLPAHGSRFMGFGLR